MDVRLRAPIRVYVTDSNQKKYHHGDLKAALLAAGTIELEETGIEGFSLRKVAKRAGVSHAAPAHHFGDVGGLLTALAAEGFRRFIAKMQVHADNDEDDYTLGAGLGYISFATATPALFRLIFTSDRPDFANPELAEASEAAFTYVCGLIEQRTGVDPFLDRSAMEDALALWGMTHGLADLISSGRLGHLQSLPDSERIATVGRLLDRVLPSASAVS